MAVPVDEHGLPNHILKYPVNSRTKIYVSFITPLVLQLLVYLLQITSDIGLVVEYFRTEQYRYGLVTILLIITPPSITFWILILSPNQCPRTAGQSKAKFICHQLYLTTFFPFSLIHSYSMRLFWSIEALFQSHNLEERRRCLALTRRRCTSELYNFVKAYVQSAPQIILILYNMLNENMFRDYETTHIQAMSLLFSAVDLAIVTMTYQRFESQKLSGRVYPWEHDSKHELVSNRKRESENYQQEVERRRTSERLDQLRIVQEFPENDKIYNDFMARHSDQSKRFADEVDTIRNVTDDEKIGYPALRRCSYQAMIDSSPSTSAPPPPPIQSQMSQNSVETGSSSRGVMKRISTIKDMLVINAELYIRDHVPRPPSMLIKHVVQEDTAQQEQEQREAPADEVDFFLPHYSQVDGAIEQDDFVGKSVAFFGWVCFIIMRMLSLATFCYFYTKYFFYALLGHYLLAFACLCWESRFKEKLNRQCFYLFLAYVYIFVILEFKIKFKNIRLWYVGSYVVMMAESLAMTFVWNELVEYDTWWFDFLYECIIYGAILFTLSLFVYYVILKPREIIVYVKDDESNQV